MDRRTIARWTLGTLCLSLPGLWLCKLADRSEALSHSRLGGALELLFIVGACVGLPALAVIILAWKKAIREEVAARIASGDIDPSSMSAADRAALYAAYGSLPKWLYMPFLAVGVLMTVLTALGILGIVIWMIVS